MSSELCAIITGPTFEKAAEQLAKAAPYADLVELRLDLFTERPLEAIKHFLDQSPLPVLVTLRKKDQGGGYTGTEDERREEIKQILRLSPSYFDLEEGTNTAFYVQQFPAVSFVISHHAFSAPHPSIENLSENLEGGTFRKIALPAENSTEALKMLNFAKQQKDLILIGMGEHGSVTRILCPLVDIPWCYAPVDTSTAPGQIPLRDLVETYRYAKLSPATQIFGLIGDPVHKSISEHTHNALFEVLGWDAVYVKMAVKQAELATFLQEAHKLGFKGISVTTPLKEAVIPHLSELTSYAQAIKGVNTLSYSPLGFSGTNTDGQGGANALERHTTIKGKKVLILGAGPAARAIAHETKIRGATVYTASRDQLAHLPPYDILINATPAPMPILEGQIHAGSLVMETNIKPLVTPFLQVALDKKCQVIHGDEMFVEQAALQFEIWGLGQKEEILPTLKNFAHQRRDLSAV